MMRPLILIVLILSVSALYPSCTHKTKVFPIPFNDGSYPADIAKIIVNKCTYSGCHNQASYQNAAGLLLDTWEHLFRGGVYGSEIVPYSTQYSPLLYYTNTDPALGTVATNPGHLDTPLTHDEYMVLHNWVAKGAPDKNGNIAFATSGTDNRQKLYLTLQGCNVVAVIDAKTKLVMRYIPIGTNTDQSPHNVQMSRDGMYAYIPFYSGGIVQKLDVHADTVMATTDISNLALGGTGHWSVITLSPMDTALLVSGWISNGCVVGINTTTMQRNPKLSVDLLTGGSTLFPYPHGLASNATFDTFYATLQNSIIKYAFNSAGVLIYNKIIAAKGAPHQIEMTPDHSRYFVTCPPSPADVTTNEVRVYDAHTDTLVKIIPVGTNPQEIAVAPTKNYMFVTCMEDAANPQVNRRGSVYVIDYNTLETVKVLYGDFFQPHGIAVDEQDGLVFVPSRNIDVNGPAPHHSTSCNGRPGWYSVYDLNTLMPADNKRYDVPVDPFAINARFK